MATSVRVAVVQILAGIQRAKLDFDVTGHYARADLFQLRVDQGAKIAVRSVVAAPE
jgi:nitrilase